MLRVKMRAVADSRPCGRASRSAATWAGSGREDLRAGAVGELAGACENRTSQVVGAVGGRAPRDRAGGFAFSSSFASRRSARYWGGLTPQIPLAAKPGSLAVRVQYRHRNLIATFSSRTALSGSLTGTSLRGSTGDLRRRRSETWSVPSPRRRPTEIALPVGEPGRPEPFSVRYANDGRAKLRGLA